MASQQVLFNETIAGMKKAFKRKAYGKLMPKTRSVVRHANSGLRTESDSDSEIDHYTNRGHKLKKRARFAHKGQLVPPTGPSAYKEVRSAAAIIEYAGIRRSIISRNTPLVDDEGLRIDSDEDEGRIDDAIAASAPLNPYANIRLEQILAPLTASTDLPTHPTLSKPFTSSTLTELIRQSCGIMRKENQSLWQVRHLWTALCGDGTWMPCSTMVGPNDAELYTEDHVAQYLLSLSKAKAEAGPNASPTNTNGDSASGPKPGQHDQPREAVENGDVSMTDASEATATNVGPHPAADRSVEESGKGSSATGELQKEKGYDAAPQTGSGEPSNAAARNEEPPKLRAAEDKPNLGPDSGALPNLRSGPGETGSNLGLTATTEALDQGFIHPLFLPPAGAKPDRNLGLPEPEAEDVRRLLALYVQKQEEVCRGASKLHQGLLRAQRLRSEVLHWSKAEAHCGANRDMSDGEDWYDKEEWGLTEDLKKGQDEEEEDTATAGKKTRNRR
ncbi:hypothetical protein S7711_05227 [Stachybotrys chartarum IBT 7711]|uniref:Transcriptional regulatory protein RXT2 N-terminal domain-containing protein n=1 Tax=Stachybotrys chartarum (strain CBS 109288 / IBT 7711) TaxID=1280523 RepID=A0A084ANJ4_STACB|nr:hypothetical protein S7711_05227 [Stachybotrys chartarum IBT 7711]KFA47774.1 hypothetical protein S40293_09034 [Stachybotrys chartarum IBT 40293]